MIRKIRLNKEKLSYMVVLVFGIIAAVLIIVGIVFPYIYLQGFCK